MQHDKVEMLRVSSQLRGASRLFAVMQELAAGSGDEQQHGKGDDFRA